MVTAGRDAPARRDGRHRSAMHSCAKAPVLESPGYRQESLRDISWYRAHGAVLRVPEGAPSQNLRAASRAGEDLAGYGAVGGRPHFGGLGTVDPVISASNRKKLFL